MKKIYGIAALTAAMTLASCSNDNEPNIVNPGATEKAYINVSLVGADGTTRADEFTQDAAVKGNEAKVDHVQFFAFNGDNYIGKSAQITNFVFSAGTGEVDKQSNRVIEIEKSAVGNNEITDIICVVNGQNFTPEAGTTVDKFRRQLGAYNTNGDYFVMSNSAYGDGNYTTSFEGKVYTSMVEAQDAPATDIYVERVAARLDLSKGTEWPKEAFASGAKVGGKDVMVTITAVDVLNNPTQAYLVKDIDNIATDFFTGWNDVANFRSHWAAWGDQKPTIPGVKYTDVKEEAYKYLYENVSSDLTDATHVVVTATYTVDGQSVEVFQSENTGDYLVEEGAKKLVANYLQNEGYEWQKVETVGDQQKTTIESVDVADIEIVESGAANVDWEGVAKINAKDGFTLVKGGTATTVDAANADMNDADSKKYKFYKWGGNKTYYYCEIAPEAQGSKAGVIRNHVYDITLNDIKGLGNPLFNPNNDLKIKEIPDITVDDSKWYLNATINILKWKVYSQGMSFGK